MASRRACDMDDGCKMAEKSWRFGIGARQCFNTAGTCHHKVVRELARDAEVLRFHCLNVKFTDETLEPPSNTRHTQYTPQLVDRTVACTRHCFLSCHGHLTLSAALSRDGHAPRLRSTYARKVPSHAQLSLGWQYNPTQGSHLLCDLAYTRSVTTGKPLMYRNPGAHAPHMRASFRAAMYKGTVQPLG